MRQCNLTNKKTLECNCLFFVLQPNQKRDPPCHKKWAYWRPFFAKIKLHWNCGKIQKYLRFFTENVADCGENWSPIKSTKRAINMCQKSKMSKCIKNSTYLVTFEQMYFTYKIKKNLLCIKKRCVRKSWNTWDDGITTVRW